MTICHQCGKQFFGDAQRPGKSSPAKAAAGTAPSHLQGRPLVLNGVRGSD